MEDKLKTKRQSVSELAQLCKGVAELEALENECKRAEEAQGEE
jgi:hypothetical protein